LIQPGEAAQAAVVVLAKSTFAAAKRHKKISLTWIVGLVLTMFATGFRVSLEQARQYEAEMDAAVMSEPIANAERRYRSAERAHYESKGWFFTCDANCQRQRRRSEAALQELQMLQQQEALRMSDVKAKVGVFSEFGVAETRQKFWESFAGGKSFAKRQSMWDLLFISLSSSRRDENAIGIILKWVVQLLFNFTIGLLGALAVFGYQLYGLVFSYQPTPLSGVAFALAAFLAAASMVATYLAAMYLCAASGIAAVGAAATAHARIEAARGGPGSSSRGYYVQQQHQGHHYQRPPGYRPHYQ